MPILKKLFFSIPFLILFYWFIFSLQPYLQNIYLIFGINLNILINLLILSLILILSSISFTIFVTLAMDWKLVLPIIILASVSPLIVFPQSVGMILAAGYLLSFGVIFLTLINKLQKYITFEAGHLLNPSVKNLAVLIILVSSFAFYLSANLEIKNKGFQVPDALIEMSLKFANPMDLDSVNVKGVKIAQSTPQVTPEQIEYLRQNPELLEQYGFDSSLLDAYEQITTPGQNSQKNSTTPQTPSGNFLKEFIKNQFEKMIEPYLPIIPAILALIFLLTVQATTSLMGTFNSLIIGSIFYLLEKSNFVKFATEMREVKKLVV